MDRVSAGVDRSPVLRDPAAQEAFRRDGYVVVPLLPPEVVARARAEVEALVPPDPGPFFSLYRNDTPELRRRLDASVRHLAEPHVDAVLRDHRTYIGSALVKAPGPDTLLDAHQDWSFVDEQRHVSGAVWIPLQDVDQTNGGLTVVPGSHRLDVPYRGTPAMPSVDPDLAAELAVPLDVPAGHAVVYHSALVHGSAANTSDRPRLVLVVGFVSREAEMVHFHSDDAGRRWRYRLTDAHSFTYQPPVAPSGPGVRACEPWDTEDHPLDPLLRALAPGAGATHTEADAAGRPGAVRQRMRAVFGRRSRSDDPSR